MDTSVLGEYGIDYKRGLARCMNDSEFYCTFLSMFLEDDSFYRAKAAMESGDRQLLFKCAHELKGVCGNADMTELYEAVCPLVELLRGGKGSDGELYALFGEVERAYLRARRGVELAVGK